MSNPTPDLVEARRTMVLSQLRPQGVADRRVLAAMGKVERETFLPESLRALAYADRPLSLDGGAPVMPPAELGQLLDRLAPVAGERALVIGAGGAYSAAVLAELGLRVETSAAVPQSGSFDVVLVEGAIEQVPPSLAAVLAPGGRVGAAIVERGLARLAIGRDPGSTKSIAFTVFADSQVPAVPGFSRAPAFSF